MKLFNDSSGKPSLTATMAIVSFIVVMIKTLLNGATVSIGTASYSFGTIDGFTIGAIFTPILGTYTARRWGDSMTTVEGSGGKPGDGAE